MQVRRGVDGVQLPYLQYHSNVYMDMCVYIIRSFYHVSGVLCSGSGSTLTQSIYLEFSNMYPESSKLDELVICLANYKVSRVLLVSYHEYCQSTALVARVH